ncbi:FAD/NAD(P)-binding domain-containing protein [Ophiobolus disseminans]|uniref:FAD/NAD(P)-binding domain-containing protein n=1 Tax=Ophiobolus disseminans TaxID=1469910 RepID=A0A6A7ACG9_9PLEO|nr:FAD/NAD(P)-binding domain-containing protein [Ophiobolus disseminans]
MILMRVLISGAGVAGPTLAWHLAKAGTHVTIVEKAKSLLPHGQNVDLQGSAVTVVRAMGLLDEVRRRNTKETGTQFIDPTGKPFAAFPIKEGSYASLSSEYEILRGDLAALLFDATRNHPNIEYLFETTITEVVTNNDDTVKVELSNREAQEFDLLVAADGQWSKIRKQCFPSESVKSIHTGMYAVYFTIPREPSDNDLWNVYVALKSRIVTVRPDPYGTIRAMFTIMPRDEAQKRAWLTAGRSDRHTQQKLLRSEFADAGWQTKRFLDAMDQAPDFYFHVIEQIKMSTWSKSRIVCLGDTAYAPTPLTGMGTSLAIVGAYMLAGELSKLNENEHPAQALAAYERQYRPYVEKSQWIPFCVPGIAHPVTAWKRWLLHAVFRILARVVAIPWVANKLGDPSNDEDFPLPDFPRFDSGSTWAK